MSITRRGLLSAFASLPIVAAISRVCGAAPVELGGFSDQLRGIVDGIDDQKVRVIWVTGRARSGKSFMARYLLAALDRPHGPACLHMPTEAARRDLCSRYDLAYPQATASWMHLRAYQYLIIDDFGQHGARAPSKWAPDDDNSEGNVLELAKRSTRFWPDGKVIVFSELEPPAGETVHHVRFAPIV